MVRLAQRAMACRWEFLIPAADGAALAEPILQVAEAAFAEIHRQEHRLSVYRDDSLVSWLNRRAADPNTAARPSRVDAEMAALLADCQRLWRLTDGAFDAAVHRLIELWGFFRGTPKLPGEAELAAALAVSGTAHVRLDPLARTVSFGVPGVALNFGSIGKGYALDRAAAVLCRAGLSRFLIHAGQSSLIAHGVPTHGVPTHGVPTHGVPTHGVPTHGVPTHRSPQLGSPQLGSPQLGSPPTEPSDRDGWWVGVADPRNPSRRLGRVRLRQAALSTSGASYRFFVHNGRRYGHTLDPRSGRSAVGTLSATVIAPTAAEADALSTALFVMGPSRAAEFCAAHSRIKALIFAEPAASDTAGSPDAPLPPPLLCGLSPADWQLSSSEDSRGDLSVIGALGSDRSVSENAAGDSAPVSSAHADSAEPEPDGSFP